MAEQKVGILSAFFRYLKYWNWRKARYILDAADQQFTGSVDGISAAFEMHRDTMVERFTGLRDAIAQVEAVLEDKRDRLEKLNQEEDDIIRKRDGALALAEKAKDEGNDADYEKHASAFERFHARIEEIEATQARLNVEIGETNATMDKYLLQLQELQAEIEKLPTKKAEAIADFVSSKQIIELNDRLQGLETSIDRGPISAVLQANRNLTAKARISEKLAGADVKLQDKQYERAGKSSSARNLMEEMLAAKKADKQAGEKVETAKTGEADDRPKI